jgi:chromate transport protein ChrA
MDDFDAMQSLAPSLPGPVYILGAVCFGLVGLAAYRSGKRSERQFLKWIGIVLMIFPYAVSEVWALLAVGTVLCLLLYWSRQ